MILPPSLVVVTDVIVHPRKSDVVISSSTDGTVRCFSMLNYSAATVNKGSAGSPTLTTNRPNIARYLNNMEDELEDFPVLMKDSAAYRSLDFDTVSASVVAVSDIGSLHQVQL